MKGLAVCLALAALAALASPTADAACSKFHGPCALEQSADGDCSAGAARGSGETFVDVAIVWMDGSQRCGGNDDDRAIQAGTTTATASWSQERDPRSGATQTDLSVRVTPVIFVDWRSYDGFPGQPCTMEFRTSQQVEGIPTTASCVAGHPLPPPALPWGFLLP